MPQAASMPLVSVACAASKNSKPIPALFIISYLLPGHRAPCHPNKPFLSSSLPPHHTHSHTLFQVEIEVVMHHATTLEVSHDVAMELQHKVWGVV